MAELSAQLSSYSQPEEAVKERLGSIYRPDREWEVWNDNYSRRTGKKLTQIPCPWVTWHPYHKPDEDYFNTLSDALNAIENYERSQQ